MSSARSYRPFELSELPTVAEARSHWMDALPRGTPAIEAVDLWASCGRVLAADVKAKEPVPAFARSVVDGVAMRAEDTAHAGAEHPVSLTVTGKVAMGLQAGVSLQPGEVALVPTGGMIPAGADAVVMVEEFPELLGAGRPDPEAVEVRRSVRSGENVIPIGADVKAGQTVVEAGTRLGPSHVGVLAGLGHATVRVYKRPEVAIL